MAIKRTYFPVAGCHWALPIYDPLARLLGAHNIHTTIVARLALAPGHRLLDIGCGTGTMAVLAKQLHAGVDVVGLDPDAKALARGARKAERAGVAVHFDRGFSDHLPYANASFDRVFSNIFSLLPHKEKETTLREVHRVLRPGGSFHLVDMVKTPPGFSFWRLFTHTRRFEFCTEEHILALIREAGLTDARDTGRFTFWLWSVVHFQASRLGPADRDTTSNQALHPTPARAIMSRRG